MRLSHVYLCLFGLGCIVAVLVGAFAIGNSINEGLLDQPLARRARGLIGRPAREVIRELGPPGVIRSKAQVASGEYRPTPSRTSKASIPRAYLWSYLGQGPSWVVLYFDVDDVLYEVWVELT